MAAAVEPARPDRARHLSGRELRVEVGLAAAVVAVAAALAVRFAADRPVPAATAALCVVAYAAAVRVPLYVGGGCAVPTQLVLVPMLFVLPPAAVPLLVVAASAAAAALEAAVRREHADRVLTAVGDAGHALAPALVLMAAGSPEPELAGWAVLTAAFAAQCGLDTALAVGREWLGRGIRPSAQLSVLAVVYGVDALVVPLGALVAAQATAHPAAIGVLLPLIALLAVVSHDRNRHLGKASDRLTELTRERERVRAAIERIGRTFASTLDRQGILEVALSTAVDAVDAVAGSASLGPEAGGCRAAVGPGDDGRRAAVLAEAEAAALASGARASVARAGWHAVAQPLCRREGPADPIGALAVCSRAAPDRDDEALLASLAVQAVASLESIDLHERIRREATVDELTGLSNHRRMHEVLGREVELARRSGSPLSFLLLDIDHFKAVNDTHGHQRGDAVLRAVGGVMRARARAGDEPARYGGEELALVLPGTDLAGAWVVAEKLRLAIAALEVQSGGRALRLSASFGVAELRPDLEDRHALVAAADAALYTAKRSGRNRTAVAGAPPAATAG